DKTATTMFTWLATVVQDVLVGAASVFESISKDRHAIKSTFVGNGLSEGSDIAEYPSGINSDCLKWVDEKAAEIATTQFLFLDMLRRICWRSNRIFSPEDSVMSVLRHRTRSHRGGFVSCRL